MSEIHTSQRNAFDVAIELVKIYTKAKGVTAVDNLEETFAKYYALARTCETTHPSELTDFLSADIKKLLNY